MSREAVLKLFDNLGVWTQGDKRAPHKPLLVLYALARFSRGETAPIPFRDLDGDLTALLKEFGTSHSYHPEYPFWYLKTDKVWVLHGHDNLRMRKGKNQPPKSSFSPDDKAVSLDWMAGRLSAFDNERSSLRDNPLLFQDVAKRYDHMFVEFRNKKVTWAFEVDRIELTRSGIEIRVQSFDSSLNNRSIVRNPLNNVELVPAVAAKFGGLPFYQFDFFFGKPYSEDVFPGAIVVKHFNHNRIVVADRDFAGQLRKGSQITVNGDIACIKWDGVRFYRSYPGDRSYTVRTWIKITSISLHSGTSQTPIIATASPSPSMTDFPTCSP